MIQSCVYCLELVWDGELAIAWIRQIIVLLHLQGQVNRSIKAELIEVPIRALGHFKII